MSKKKKITEDKIWLIVTNIIPVIILINVGSLLVDHGIERTFYAALFGGLGGLLGSITIQLTKDKNRVVKIFATICLILISICILVFFSKKQSDEYILEQEWISQKIGLIEFDSPYELVLMENDKPEFLYDFYSEISSYGIEKNGRMTLFLKTKILADSIQISDAYLGALESMLKKVKVDMEEVEFDIFTSNESEVAIKFSYFKGGNLTSGYGYMYNQGKILESLWLMPIRRGFSDDFIEAFDLGIFPDEG